MGTDHQLNPSKTAFIAVDVQSRFCKPDTWGASLPMRVGTFVQGLADKPILFIYTRTVGDSNRMPENVRRFRELRGFRPEAAANAPDSALCPMYRPPSALIIEKPCFDAFAYTSLNEQLQKRLINSVLIAGVMADVCVEATARRAVMEGYDTYILKDLTAAPEEHAENVTRAFDFFTNYYGYVLDSGQLHWIT